MVGSGSLIADSAGWRIDPLSMADLQSSSRAGELLSHRIDLLPATTIGLLSAGAVLGTEFPIGSAATILGGSPVPKPRLP